MEIHEMSLAKTIIEHSHEFKAGVIKFYEKEKYLYVYSFINGKDCGSFHAITLLPILGLFNYYLVYQNNRVEVAIF